MSFYEFIRNLQKKPYAVRLRILWATTALTSIVLILIWVFTIKNGIGNLNGQNLFNVSPIQDQGQETTIQESNHITIERVELSEHESFQIFFKIKNPTKNILNFSPADKIRLKAGGSSLAPLQILDRQNNAFVKKILSETENFGTLIFSQTEANKGQITFDGLFFEDDPGVLFRETIDLDFLEQNKSQELRN
jgi:hypothetical protein